MKPKILVIDDEPDIRVYLAAAIEDNGFEPLLPGAGETGIAAIAKKMPDLIVLDIMMPRQSGISIYKELRASRTLKHIPVILISGMASASDFMENGFRKMVHDENIPPPDGFIEKPVDINILIREINNLIGPALP